MDYFLTNPNKTEFYEIKLRSMHCTEYIYEFYKSKRLSVLFLSSPFRIGISFDDKGREEDEFERTTDEGLRLAGEALE